MRRVSAGNRMIPAPHIVKATNEDHQPTTTVVYSAAESLKKLKDKLARTLKVRNHSDTLPTIRNRTCLHGSVLYLHNRSNLFADLAASRSVSTAAEENVNGSRHDCQYLRNIV